jgi:hypothetical protein
MCCDASCCNAELVLIEDSWDGDAMEMKKEVEKG